MTITHLVTHSGGFHADELLSSVILTRLFPDAVLVRSRDPGWTAPDASRIIYDVGRAYDAEAQVFDHHQRPNPLRDDGQPFSSFGLIWRHFGENYLRAMAVPETDLAEIHQSVDREFVLPVDLLDNGALAPSEAGLLAGMTLPVLLETLKPAFDERRPDAEDQAFAQALPVARAFVEAAIRTRAAKRRAEDTVLQAIESAGKSPVLELPAGMPFRAAIDKAGADHMLFVVHPRGDDWALTTIRKTGDSFENRADLPASWAGLTDAKLEQACGVKGATFCHNARFIAVARTRDAILEMAHLAVRQVSWNTPGTGMGGDGI
ncbi:MYG1 family protein [Rhodobacteraceae bacterium F11138]|nr:MYG1 family protein [Rhodobacteraceae bacterium F11138]